MRTDEWLTHGVIMKGKRTVPSHQSPVTTTLSSGMSYWTEVHCEDANCRVHVLKKDRVIQLYSFTGRTSVEACDYAKLRMKVITNEKQEQERSLKIEMWGLGI